MKNSAIRKSRIRGRAVPFVGTVSSTLLVLALIGMTQGEESNGKWVIQPKHIGASLDLGHISKGVVENELDYYGITRTGAYTSIGAVYDSRLEVRIGVGGLFWYAASNETDPVRRLVRYGAGAGEASGVYSFGDPSTPSSKLQIGLFPIKYSPSHNLGEYLYRSGTYPGYLITGGWSYMDASSYLAEGVRFSLPTFGSKVVHEFTVLMERDLSPLNDFSPGYNLTVKPNSFLEFGGGIVWSHGLSTKPSHLARKEKENAYSKNSNLPVFGAEKCLNGNGICEVSRDTLPIGHPDNPLTIPLTVVHYDTSVQAKVTLSDWQRCKSGDCSDIGYYTFRGFKAVARATVDFGALIDVQAIPPGTFRAYGEVALLGVENQPFFYEKRSERMPMTLGVDVPTFGILDRLSAEVEYNKSRFRNTTYAVNQNQYPIPLGHNDLSGSETGGYGYMGAGETKDDLKWSILANRKLAEGLNIRAQVASDHMRHPDFWGVMSDEPATRTKDQWYYVLRLDFGF
jgi:hypothetical protein